MSVREIPLEPSDRARAMDYAIVKHGSQTYADEIPYSRHCVQVSTVLHEFGFGHDLGLMCAAPLHDVLEDTSTSYGDIAERFGLDVAELVFAVTNELGRDRFERAQRTYPKIAGNDRATALKLVDRIANVRYGVKYGGGMLTKYRKEYPDFRAALISPKDCAAIANSGSPGTAGDPGPVRCRVRRMWCELDRLLALPSDVSR